MSDLDDIYSAKILELAAHIPRTERLAAPDATASARSKLCGSEIEIDLALTNGIVSGYSQTVKACLLGQATASVVGREIVGSGPGELRAVAKSLRAMLKENGAPPAGRWADLQVLQPVREYKHRHDAVLLVFDAVEKALALIEAKAAAA
jgi:NifU-like protein involved in Fe-S cluster formation